MKEILFEVMIFPKKGDAITTTNDAHSLIEWIYIYQYRWQIYGDMVLTSATTGGWSETVVTWWPSGKWPWTQNAAVPRPAPPRVLSRIWSSAREAAWARCGGAAAAPALRPTSAVRSVPTGQPRTQQPAQHKVPTHIIYLGKPSIKTNLANLLKISQLASTSPTQLG